MVHPCLYKYRHNINWINVYISTETCQQSYTYMIPVVNTLFPDGKFGCVVFISKINYIFLNVIDEHKHIG